MNTSYDTDFEARMRSGTWNAKFWRFARYLTTRKVESWGFFIAGLMIGGLFF